MSTRQSKLHVDTYYVHRTTMGCNKTVNKVGKLCAGDDGSTRCKEKTGKKRCDLYITKQDEI